MPTVCTLEKTSQTHHVLQEQPLFWSQSIGFKGVFSDNIMPKDGLKQLDHGVSTDVGLAHFESETLVESSCTVPEKVETAVSLQRHTRFQQFC